MTTLDPAQTAALYRAANDRTLGEYVAGLLGECAARTITVSPVEWARELAVAWDKGWREAWTPMSPHNLDDGPNPYGSAE